MAERTTQQLERDLDTFWNALVAGESPLPKSAETVMVARLATVDATPAPQAAFLDELWSQLVAPGVTEPSLPIESAPAAPASPWPARPVVHQRSRFQRWGKLAAAIAALLAVVAAGALLLADRQQSGPTPAGQPWSMAEGNPGKTNSNPEAPAIADPRVQWRVETNGRIDGVPVVSGGLVLIGNREHHMYAIDTETGLQLWDANLRKPITGTAAVGDGIVVVGTSTTLYGLDAKTGAAVWQRDDLVAASDPTIVDDAIYLVDDGNRLRALDLETGADRWTSEPFSTIPAFAIDTHSGRMFVSTQDGMLIALSDSDGKHLWEVDPGLGTLGEPLVDGDLVALPIAGGVALVDGATGRVGVKNALPFEGIPSLALAEDHLVASTDVMVVAYDRDSLEVHWSNQLLTGLTGGVSLGSSSIYLPGEDRTLTALDQETGEVQWSLPLDEVAQLAPAVTSKQLFIATRAGSVYAIGAKETAILQAPTLEIAQDAADAVRPLWKSTGGPNALKNPTGIAVAPSGEIWVCDTASDRLQIFDSQGNFLREFGSHGSQPGQFDFGAETAEMDGHAPLGNACSVAFDASGALYVADAANQRVQRFPANALGWMIHSCCTIQANGTPLPYPASEATPDLIIGSEGTGPGQFLFATDVAVAPNGDIYVGDQQRLDIQRFDAAGTYLETIGKPVAGGLVSPGTFSRIAGMTIGGDGRLYVADEDQQQIVRLESDDTWTAVQLPRRDSRISGLAVDGQGNIFVSQFDSIAGSFWIYSPTGAPITQVGSHGNELGQFDGPSGIGLDGQGNAYVADWAIGRIQKFQIDDAQLGAKTPDAGG